MCAQTVVVVAARDEAERIGATLAALAAAFPGARLWVADDGSRDATAAIARAAGANVSSRGNVSSGARARGKGAAVTRATRAALRELETGADSDAVFVLCDGDLGESARELAALPGALGQGADLAVAAFRTRAGGGLGLAVGFARWAVRGHGGPRMRAPISGQRAMRARTLRALLPFADGFGMELGMTLDALRAGLRVTEVELELEHRASGRTPAGFAHRGRQLRDFLRAYRARVTLGGDRGRPLR